MHLLVSTNKITIILINRITALFHVWAPCCHTVHYRIIVQDYHSCLVRTCRFHIVRHWVGPFSIVCQRAVTPTEFNWSPKCNKKKKSDKTVKVKWYQEDFCRIFLFYSFTQWKSALKRHITVQGFCLCLSMLRRGSWPRVSVWSCHCRLSSYLCDRHVIIYNNNYLSSPAPLLYAVSHLPNSSGTA